MGTTDVGSSSIQGCTSQGRLHGAAYKGPQASQLPLFSQDSLPITEKPRRGAKRKEVSYFYFFKGSITEKKAIRISGLKKKELPLFIGFLYDQSNLETCYMEMTKSEERD